MAVSYTHLAEVHILEEESASRAYIGQMWAEAMEIYRSGRFKMCIRDRVQVMPGVTIGSNVVIGGGSVVVKDIPDNSVAVGNPCKVIRAITDEDKKTCWDR